ncbi:helix-hairpin-helix domain-containing protein [Ideonella sp.]|uniref:helix-hairpin-helix domain-containing protein n=1 Tax=Ideonella sp. TaxID=1929293 RepID=UPI002B465B1C|nr:helix-hairpin-helix domain-containing protein [Ideonella sp.]HJV69772.1 helix-hairpin-helix domain-containing protein [Ideonella sp.]
MPIRPIRPVRPIKAPKAASAAECQALEQLPNVGPAMAGDLRLLGIQHPADLRGRDAFALYRALERATGQRQDPCVLDTFMAIVDFMQGAEPKPWWAYTAARKQLHGQVAAAG